VPVVFSVAVVVLGLVLSLVGHLPPSHGFVFVFCFFVFVAFFVGFLFLVWPVGFW